MNEDSMNTAPAGNPGTSTKPPECFIIQWTCDLKRMTVKYAGVAAPAVLIIFGLLYQGFFFGPLNIPIFNLSSLSDFILPGLRHSFALVLVTIVGFISAILIFSVFALLLNKVFSYFIRCSVWFVLLAVRLPAFFIYVASVLVIGLLWGIGYLLCIIFRKIPTFLPLTVFAGRMAGILAQKCASNINFARTCFCVLKSQLHDVEKSISRWSRSLLNWEKINAFLSKRLCVFLCFTLLVAALIVALKAGYDSKLIKYNMAGNSGYKQWYSDRLLPVSRVEVRFRPEDVCPQNLLLLGNTSDFFLFWQEGDHANPAKPLVVEKSTVSLLLPETAQGHSYCRKQECLQ